ncbi:MAG: histidine phosphatase family protein [Fibrobacteria bacterium]|nr:histidine phosphatase family protein [Fibrobacteria bacterium]
MFAITTLNKQLLVETSSGRLFANGAVVQLSMPVVIVRHGETEGNKLNILQGQVDSDTHQLTAFGKMQAGRAAKRLVRQLIEYYGSESALRQAIISHKVKLYVSPLTRARDSAGYFITHIQKDLDVSIDMLTEELLTEMYFGVLDGKATGDISDIALRGLLARYRAIQDATIDWKGSGESFVALVNRARQLIENWNMHFMGTDTVIIGYTHGTFSSALRTIIGDASILNGCVIKKDAEFRMVAYREKMLKNADVFWLKC